MWCSSRECGSRIWRDFGSPSCWYEAGEITAGAVAARLRADNVPGIRAVPGSSPLSARKIS